MTQHGNFESKPESYPRLLDEISEPGLSFKEAGAARKRELEARRRAEEEYVFPEHEIELIYSD